MNQDNELSPLEQRTRAALRDSVRNLDGASRSRIAQARSAAISQRDARPGWFDLRHVVSAAGAVATAILVTVLISGRQDVPAVNDPPGSALYDLELLADADAFELSQETDLEFIEWAAAMGEQDQAGT